MNRISITDLSEDSDEEYQNAEEEVSNATDEDYQEEDADDDANQPTDEEESQAEQQFGYLTEKLTADKLVLLAKRDARLESVNVLHKKLLNTWSDKMKCQQEYGCQYMRSIETSQIVWESKIIADNTRHNSRQFSNGRSQLNKETLLQENERCAKQRVEQLAKDLLEATEKRIKTLEEVISLISRELDEAKQDCQALDKELVETEVQLLKTEGVITLNECEETQVADKSSLAEMSTHNETNRNMLRAIAETRSSTRSRESYRSSLHARRGVLRKNTKSSYCSTTESADEEPGPVSSKYKYSNSYESTT